MNITFLWIAVVLHNSKIDFAISKKSSCKYRFLDDYVCYSMPCMKSLIPRLHGAILI